MNDSYLIAGLGNPGRKYRKNRHNIGFIAVDELAHQNHIEIETKMGKSLYGKGYIAGYPVILMKPQTYMNLSGEAVGWLQRYFKISMEHLIVISDDVDLPFGTLRIRTKGSAGGQKGLLSIIQNLGSDKFTRVRVGIGRPPERMDTSSWVLTNFMKEEIESLHLIVNKISESIETIIEDSVVAAMNKFNGMEIIPKK